MPSPVTTHQDNLAWFRQLATHWARRLVIGIPPAAWASDTTTQVQFAVRQLRLRPGDRVLDLGCGWGRHSVPLAAQGMDVTGLDVSGDLLALARHHARRHGLGIGWIEADVADLPFHGTFDAVVQFCGNLLTWFPHRTQAQRALRTVASLLKPGGRILLGRADWQAELPPRAQDWDEWHGGAAIYRQRYDPQRRIAHAQTVVFDPAHRRHEYHRRTWWPAHQDMEELFEAAGLAVQFRSNAYHETPFDPGLPGLIYVLERVTG